MTHYSPDDVPDLEAPVVHWQPTHRPTTPLSPAQSLYALGAVAVGATALGAFAVGALAVGALAIGRLAVGRARLHVLEIDELVVRKLRLPHD